ncbi:hypothetical protein [Microbacterium sp. NPDC056569]|uniref:hypothetical protein n=1 Tax=Microbacterium sp. NPDC056569 TaxID=3345867 RepID=UPI00367124CC
MFIQQPESDRCNSVEATQMDTTPQPLRARGSVRFDLRDEADDFEDALRAEMISEGVIEEW